MKKFLGIFLLLMLSANSIIADAKVQNHSFEASVATEDSFIELLARDPEAVYEKYGNIIDIQTLAIDNLNYETARAFQCNEDGILLELDCEVTLNKISYQEEVGAKRSSVSTLYVLNAEAKTSSDSTTDNGITVRGAIHWIDYFGPSNVLTVVSGSQSGACYGDGTYKVLSGNHMVADGSGSFSNSFYNEDVRGETGSKFSLIINSYTKTGEQVSLIVQTSIWD